MALNANALVTLAQAKSYLGIPTLDTSQDTRVEEAINAASDHVEQRTSRRIKKQAYTHYLNGNDRSAVVLREFPADKPTVVNVDQSWTYGAATLVPTTDYDVDYDGTVLIRRTCFPRGVRNVKVTYDAGYAVVPADLQQAALLLVGLFYWGGNDQRIGVESSTKVNESVAYSDKFPETVAALIAPYVRKDYLAARLGLVVEPPPGAPAGATWP